MRRLIEARHFKLVKKLNTKRGDRCGKPSMSEYVCVNLERYLFDFMQNRRALRRRDTQLRVWEINFKSFHFVVKIA